MTDPDKEIIFEPTEILARVRPSPHHNNGHTDEEKIEAIKRHFEGILTVLGMDLTNDSIRKTPERMARMYVNEIFAGLKPENFPKVTVIENEMEYDEMVVVKDVSVLSICEHHLTTFCGRAHVAYIPNKRVVGLSKINRIVKYFSRRPQVQERLTKQIADCLEYVLQTKNVAVIIDAKHYCVVSRGIEDINSTTLTSDLRGAFKDDIRTRSEFMNHLRMPTVG